MHSRLQSIYFKKCLANFNARLEGYCRDDKSKARFDRFDRKKRVKSQGHRGKKKGVQALIKITHKVMNDFDAIWQDGVE